MNSLYNISFLNFQDEPKGIRNNNPGNIKKFNDKWQGMLPQTDGPFIQFSAFCWGVRALIKILRNKISKNKQNTIRKIVYSYGMENNSPSEIKLAEAYIKSLVKQTGLNENMVLTTSKEHIKLLAQAIANHENGKKDVITDEMFNLSYILSLT